MGGYQFDLESKLVPVPENMHRDRAPGLRNLPFRVEDGKGNLICRIQFIPWQTGGVIQVMGKLPLEAFLIFVGPVMKNAKRMKRPDGEMSSVLPITEPQFGKCSVNFNGNPT
jgi:hypothetical protein